MSKDILLSYKCPCGKRYDIYWSTYKQLVAAKNESPDLNCYCDLVKQVGFKELY
jgi:hypothetical protein